MSDWLPPGFESPAGAIVPYGHRLRRIRSADARRMLVAIPGLGLAGAERLLRRRLGEMSHRAAYTFALVDADETALLGEVRVAPGHAPGVDAEVTWWIVPECRDTDLASAVDALVPAWVKAHWPFTAPLVEARPAPLLALPQGEC